MKELAETGWMSNRGRQNVASFLTKDLEIDWRLGAEYFEMILIDYDVATNWINWQHIADVGGTDPREDRYFNVIKQAYDYDPNGEYVKLWLPQLSSVPTNYIYCPFKLSYGDQARYKCKEYPQPLVKIKADWNPLKREIVSKNAIKP
jgi:deoxyribodipyrimidine photo-lyase